MHLVIACLGMLVAPLQQPGASPLDRPVTLALERVSLKTALDQVARQARVRIAYSRRVVPLDRPVSAQLEGVPVRVALDTLLQGTGAVPTLDRTGQILLTDPPGDRPALAQGSITGTVRTGAAATPLAGVNVIAVGTSFSATTEHGLKFEFEYRDDTLVSQSAGTFARVDELLETAARLPLEAGRKVRVQWKSSADKKKRIATKIAAVS